MKKFWQSLIILLLAFNSAQAAISTKTLTVRATVVKPCQIAWGAQISGAAQPRAENCDIAIHPRDDNHSGVSTKPSSVQHAPQNMLEGKAVYSIERNTGGMTIKF